MVKHNGRYAVAGNVGLVDQLTLPGHKSVLTVRASKSDIDAYAKGTLTAEDFAKHALITTYTSGSGGAGPEGIFVGAGSGGKARF